MKPAQLEMMEKLLLLLLFFGYAELLLASNFTDYDWLNETQSPQEDYDSINTSSGFRIISDITEKNSIYAPVQEDYDAANNLSGYRIISDINEKNSINAPMDPVMRMAFVALLLHILVVGGGIIIYSVVYCKSRASKKRLMEVKRRLQSPLTLQHLPNTPNCPCHGCRVARQILSGLIVQQIITERSEH